MVGLRGRSTGTAGPKWISASGSTSVLWNAAGVRAGCVTWIVENYVDAAWMMERHPEWDAVALGGANWRSEWAIRLAARRPRQVIVALDNDLAGQAAGPTLQRLSSEWGAAHPGLQPPEPSGPRIVRSLRAAGLDDVLLFPWGEDAPDHADLGWLLAQREDE